MDTTSRLIAQHVRHTRQHWKTAIFFQATLIASLAFFFVFIAAPMPADSPSSPFSKRSWGGYSAVPQSEQCYKQERTATLLSLWLGLLGIDQWYARHWVLAVFKTLTLGGFGIWALVDINLWVVGGVYGTHGCGGGWRH